MQKLTDQLFGLPYTLISFSDAEDASPVGYHVDGTRCYATVRKCPKGGVVQRDGDSPVLDLSIPQNAKAFKGYMEALPAAPMPPRLTDGSPKAALAWFEENLVGKRFEYDLPVFGKRYFEVNPGHIFRFTCETPKESKNKLSKVRKGFIKKANSPEHARALIRAGQVSASDCEGWKEPRARSLPMVQEILENYDAILFDHKVNEKTGEKEHALLFLKKFVSSDGIVNVIVMRLDDADMSIGPRTSHPKKITTPWLNGQTLISVAGNKGPTRVSDSVDAQGGRRDSTESITQPNADSIAHSSLPVNGDTKGKTAASDVAPFNAKAFADFLSKN